MPSFRRQGLIVKDAIQDIHNLCNFVCETLADIKEVFLEGESMGGAIVTYISESGGSLSF